MNSSLEQKLYGGKVCLVSSPDHFFPFLLGNSKKSQGKKRSGDKTRVCSLHRRLVSLNYLILLCMCICLGIVELQTLSV